MKNAVTYQELYMRGGFEDYLVKYRRKKILNLIDEKECKRILEIGVGMEPIVRFLHSFDIYCFIEPAEDFYKNAVDAISTSPELLQRCVGYNEYFRYSEDLSEYRFDYIVCSSLLHEVPDPELMLRTMCRLCTNKTIVHVNVPNADSFHRILAVKSGIIENTKEFTDRNKLFGQYTVFDKASLEGLVRKAGFRIVNSGGIMMKPFTHGQMYQMVETRIIDEKVLDGLAAMADDYPDLASEIYFELMKE